MKKLTKKQLESLKLGRRKGLKKPGAGFKKGNTPWNKNLKGIHLSSKSEWKKGKIPKNAVLFKKGETPWNKGKNDVMPRGKNHPSWKGGRILHQGRYYLVLKPNHPKADSKGYVREHRLIMEEYLGRYLNSNELIHHLNGNKLDNRVANLELISRSEHIKLHKEQLYKARWRY